MYDGSASGVIVYAYSPYGEATTLGPDEGNTIQYTARENDQTGLYYYRARYYDPVLKRFISEDPIGLRGGINVFGYVAGDPIDVNDPSGEVPLLVLIPLIGGGINAVIAGIQQSRCSGDFGDILKAAGRGFVSGAIGTAVGLGVGFATKNPAVIGASAGLAENLTHQLLSGHAPDPIDAAIATGSGAIGGVLGHTAFPPGPGRPASLLRDRALGDFGPKSIEKLGGEAVAGTVTSGLTATLTGARHRSCECR